MCRAPHSQVIFNQDTPSPETSSKSKPGTIPTSQRLCTAEGTKPPPRAEAELQVSPEALFYLNLSPPVFVCDKRVFTGINSRRNKLGLGWLRPQVGGLLQRRFSVVPSMHSRSPLKAGGTWGRVVPRPSPSGWSRHLFSVLPGALWPAAARWAGRRCRGHLAGPRHQGAGCCGAHSFSLCCHEGPGQRLLPLLVLQTPLKS